MANLKALSLQDKQDQSFVIGANTSVLGQRVFGGPTDPISDVPVYIDYDHHQIHEGETFRWSNYATVGNGTSKDFRLSVPNITVPSGVPVVARMPHFRFEVVSSDSTDIFIYETPTFSGSGTLGTPVALERNGTYSAQLAIYSDPTAGTVGNLIWRGMLTTTKNSGGGINISENEFILKNNTEYLFRVTSGANGNKILTRFVWYEDLGV